MKLIQRVFVIFIVLIGLNFTAQMATAQDAQLQELQVLLTEHGYSTGKADGIMGPRTKHAIEKFQGDMGLSITGKADISTLNAIKKFGPVPVNTRPKVLKSTNTSNAPPVIVWVVLGALIAFMIYLTSDSKTNKDRPNRAVSSTNSLKNNGVADEGKFEAGWQGKSNSKYSHAYQRPLRPDEIEEDDDDADELATFTLNTTSKSKTYYNDYAYDDDHITAAQIKSEGNACWKAKGVSMEVAGIEIPLGMIYVGSKLRTQKYGAIENCLINPRLKVAKNSEGFDDDEIGYWPSYKELDPQARREYLLWLSSGAKRANANVGFVFLYFYGLERRLLLEQAVDEKQTILKEMNRLLRIYGQNNSVSRYIKTAISYATIFDDAANNMPAMETPQYNHWELPTHIALYLGRKVQSGRSLTNDDVLLWFLNHPERHLRTPAHRLNNEFIALMKLKLNELQPDGPKIRNPKRKLDPKYTSSSSTFTVDFKTFIKDVPDFSGIKAPISVVQGAADEAMDELDKLSRLLGREPDAKGSIKALGLLPRPLLSQFGGDRIEGIQNWIVTRQKGEFGIFTFQEILDKATDSNKRKVTKSLHHEIFAFMEGLGWSMLPAPHEIIGTVKPDTKLLLTPLNPSINVPQKPTEALLLMVLEISLGSYIAHSDETLLDVEVGVLIKRVKDHNLLSSSERARLYDLIKWLAIQKVDLGAINRKLKKLDQKAKNTLADIAVSVAVVDGNIAPKEVKALESVYKALGFEQANLYSTLHSFGGSKRQSAKLLDASQAQQSGGNVGLSLNMDRVNETLEDTEKAAALLAGIFEDDDETIDPSTEVENNGNLFQGLDIVHAQMLTELLERNEWPREEYDLLATSLKLFPNGAMEVINEWAFENFDDAIIEDDDPIVINKELLTEGET